MTRTIEAAPAPASMSADLRAVIAQARHMRNEGLGKEAHDLLSPVYGWAWFTEGFDAGVLSEAKLLLDELG
ncbi:MAG: hypothetical protein QF926_06880 [Alphaproteobacteria bacterium]|nr:hypothetical protein [Alphaproteobacteria bacterium]